MDKNENMKKLIPIISLIFWSAIVLSAFYITQRPLVIQILGGLASTLWSIALMIILQLSAAVLGYFILRRIQAKLQPHERLILGTGFGLGIFGLAGFGLGAVGLATPPLLGALLIAIIMYAFISKMHLAWIDDLRSFINALRETPNETPRWLPLAVLITCLVSFFFALLPPADGFDGLLYHLRLPELLLADGKLPAYNNFPFWFPSLVEGDYVWALGLGSERTAQLIHWSFFMLTLALLWEWARQVFKASVAWWALAILISIPSLPWLAAWAYTDLALAFFTLAGLYSLWRWYEKNEDSWLYISGLFAGMAMGVKYTSFILPVLSVLLVFFRERNIRSRIVSSIKFSIPALLIASPWYLRNWLIMGNPFYPFIFGGLYWDSFRTDWYSGFGSGIGWDLQEILLLPLTITLGYRDQTFYDGRIGPLFLLLFPLAIWAIWIKRSATAAERNTLLITGSFTLLSYLFWAFSVTQTIYLWQSRLLFPGLIPLAIPIGLAISGLGDFNLPRFRVGFIMNGLIGMVIFISVLDNGLLLLARRPLAYIFGMESRQEYFERIQPNYSEALALVNSTPQDAFVYFLLEPRSYNMTRNVQADPLNDNLPHDYYLFKTTEAIINQWKLSGYTHILVYKSGVSLFAPDGGELYEHQFDEMLKELKLEETSKNYSLYSIP